MRAAGIGETSLPSRTGHATSATIIDIRLEIDASSPTIGKTSITARLASAVATGHAGGGRKRGWTNIATAATVIQVGLGINTRQATGFLEGKVVDGADLTGAPAIGARDL